MKVAVFTAIYAGLNPLLIEQFSSSNGAAFELMARMFSVELRPLPLNFDRSHQLSFRVYIRCSFNEEGGQEIKRRKHVPAL